MAVPLRDGRSHDNLRSNGFHDFLHGLGNGLGAGRGRRNLSDGRRDWRGDNRFGRRDGSRSRLNRRDKLFRFCRLFRLSGLNH